MIALHPKIVELKKRTAGKYLTCRYADASGKESQVNFQSRTDALPEGEVEAYVAVFGVRDSYGTIAMKGCFAKSIQERGPQAPGNEKIVHLFFHDKQCPLGTLTAMEEDDYGLKVRIRFDIEAGGKPLQIYKQVRSGTVRQYSYGFDYIWDKMKYDANKDAVLMYETAVYETSSITINSANPSAFTIRTKEDFQAKMDDLGEQAEEILRNVPRGQRMELKQLFSEYTALAERAKPDDAPLPESKPQLFAIGGYNLDVTKL